MGEADGRAFQFGSPSGWGLRWGPVGLVPPARTFPHGSGRCVPVAAFASSRFLRFARRFGPRAALQAARMDRPGGEPVEVRLPGVAHPLWARPRTSDVATFDEIFLGREYDLPWKCFEPAHILDLGANVGYTSVFFA